MVVQRFRVIEGMADRLLTARDVAERLSISTATVYKLVAAGAIPCLRVSNAIRFRAADLRTYVERIAPPGGSGPMGGG
jgi:excisionase family DNA binding protein